MKAAILAAGLLVGAPLSGCAGISRMQTYGSHLADAKVVVDGRNYSLWVHPTENDILVQRGIAAAMGQSLVQGATFGAANMTEPKPVWRRAAESLTAPLGCTVTDVYSLDNRITWDAPFTCPAGVDLHAAVTLQRADLRKGAARKVQAISSGRPAEGWLSGSPLVHRRWWGHI